MTGLKQFLNPTETWEDLILEVRIGLDGGSESEIVSS